MKKVFSILLTLTLCLGLAAAISTQEVHAETYSIWVGGTEVTSDNASDVFGDGTVSYDTATNTLTLKNYSYSGQGWKNYSSFYGIYLGMYGDLKVQLVGDNNIQLAAPDTNCNSYGLFYSNYDKLTFKGSGSLTVRGGDLPEGTSTSIETAGMGGYYGDIIFGNEFTGSVTALGGKVTNAGSSIGLFASSGCDVFNGTVVCMGGDFSATGSIYSLGSKMSSTANIYGGSFTSLGGKISTSNGYAYSYGVYGSSLTVNVFDGTLIMQGGSATGTSSAYSNGTNWGTLNLYGGVTVAQGGAAAKTDTSNFSGLYSIGADCDVRSYGGVLIARGGTLNDGYRVVTKGYGDQRSAIDGRFLLGEGMKIAGAVGYSDVTGTSGFGELTVTSDNSTAANLSGSVGGVSNYSGQEGLGSGYLVYPTGIVIVPSDWTETDTAGTLTGNSYNVRIDGSDLSASSVQLGSYSLLSANLYEGTAVSAGTGLNLSGGISGNGGTLVAAGPTLTGAGSVSSGLMTTGAVSGNIGVIAVGGTAPVTYGLGGSGTVNASGLTEDGKLIATGLASALGSGTAVNAGALGVIDQEMYYSVAYYENTAPTYTVTITPGAHMTLAEGSGDLVQTGNGPLTTIILTADEGYYFPKDYVEKNFLPKDSWNIEAAWSRSGYGTTIKISGTPGTNHNINLADAELYVYPVWIGGVRVTALNKDDLVTAINEAAGEEVATGTAVYTPGTLRFHSSYPEIVMDYNGTITLTDFTYKGEGYQFATGNDKYAALYVDAYKLTYPQTSSEYRLTVELSGSNSITQHVSSTEANADDVYGIYFNGGGNRDQGISFTGSGNLTATAEVVDSKNIAAGLYVYGHCYAKSGAEVTFTGPSGNVNESSGIILRSNTYYLGASSNGIFTASGDTYAINDLTTPSNGYSRVQYSAPYYLLAGSSPDGSDASPYSGTGEDNAKDLMGYKFISLGQGELFVAGMAVTDGNANDIAAAVNAAYPGSMTGTATYDSSTHTLTLKDADISNLSTGEQDINYWGITYYGKEPLNVVVNGTNSVTGKDRSDDDTYGICSDYGINFTGSGKLVVTGGNVSTYDDSGGIYGAVTVDGPDIEAYGGSTRDYSYGIDGSVTLKSGSLKAVGGKSSSEDSYGIDGSVLVEGGTLTATGGTAYDYSYGIDGTLTLQDGEVYANGGPSTGDYSVGLYSAEVNGGKLTVTCDVGYDGNYGIYSSLTVNDGEVIVNSGDSKYSVGVDGTTTINGGKTTINAGNAQTSRGIYASTYVYGGELYVNGGTGTASGSDSTYSYGVSGTLYMHDGGTAKITSAEATYSYAVNGYPYIKGGSLELIANGTQTAQICSSTPSLEEKVAVLIASPNADASDPVPYVKSDYATYKYLKTGPGYALWVGDKQIHAGIADDVFGDNKVSFDPKTVTLTINGADLTASGNNAVIHYNDNDLGPLTIEFAGTSTLTYTGTNSTCGIYSSAHDADYNDYPLTIKLADDAVVNIVCPTISSGYDRPSYGIRLWSPLTIDGAGTFNINASDFTGEVLGSSTGLYATDLILSGGVTLNVNGGDCDAVYSDRTCDSMGVYLNRDLTIEDGCTLNAAGGSVIGSNNSSYPATSDGLCMYPGTTVTLSGSAKALVKGGTYTSGNYGGSYGFFALGWDSKSIVFDTSSWTGEFDMRGESGHSAIYYIYGSYAYARDVDATEMTVFENSDDTEGTDITYSPYWCYGRNTTDKRLLIYPNSSLTVTITAADGMTPAAAYKETVKSKNSMTEQIYTAADGYYFPEDYASIGITSGIEVSRIDYSQIKVSGTPTAAVDIKLAAATAKAAAAVPTGVDKTDCTTVANNDGAITGVDKTMEYQKSSDSSWTAITGSTVEGLAPGTYSVRVKATDTAYASEAVNVTIAEYNAPKFAITVDGGSALNSAGKTITEAVEGETVKLSYEEPDGMGFDHWEFITGIGASDLSNDQFTMPAEAVSLKAVFLERVATPVLEAESTVFKDSLDVTISCMTSGAAIHYTLDGSDPTANSSTFTSGSAITLTKTTTVKAIAVLDGYADSEIASQTYTLKSASGGATTYPVKPVEAENGEITVSPKRASKGRTVTVTVTPDEGYELDKLVVKDKDGNEIEVTDNGDGTYTFKMPDSEVEIEPVFKEAEPETPAEDAFPFVDVPEDAYFRKAVEWALKEGVTGGTTPTTFSPYLDATRAQTVTFLWAAAGAPDPETTENPFKDISESDYFYKAVLWAYENGITAGVSEDEFGPYRTVTRGQVVTFLYGYAGRPEAGTENPFTDVSESDYFCAPVLWAYREDITAGTSATTFSPDDPCLRGQIITFMYLFFGAE
ncbi:MAG: S-layer homology domain-containing protein [Firmicutes bacterium]|nr:S-layer homology domain-containing protein [Bacillota bacterium]